MDPQQPRSPDRPSAGRRYGREKRLLLAALGVSALLHSFAFLAIRFEVDVAPQPRRTEPLPTVRIAPAMQAYDLILVEGDPAPIEVQIMERMQRDAIAPLPIPPPPGASALAPPQPGVTRERAPSITERLEYRARAPEAWRPPARVPSAALRPDAPLNAQVAASVQAYRDSLVAEAQRRERATDWTVKDEDGGRWGVSPGRIHLGDVTLPLPFAFSPPPGRRDEINGRIRTWEETRIQTARAEVEDVTRDRVRATRARIDAERARRFAADSAARAIARADSVRADSTTSRSSPPPFP